MGHNNTHELSAMYVSLPYSMATHFNFHCLIVPNKPAGGLIPYEYAMLLMLGSFYQEHPTSPTVKYLFWKNI